MSYLAAGNSFITERGHDCVDAVHTNAVLNAVNANGINGVQTTQSVGNHIDSTVQRGFDHTDSTAQRMALAELDAIGKVGNEVCDSSRDIMRDIHATDNHLNGSVERMGLFNNSAIERTSDKTQGVVDRSAYKTQDEVEKFGFRELDAISCVGKEVHNSERYLYAGMSQNAKEMLVEFERTKLRIDSNTKDLLLQACHNTSDIKMQAEIHAKDAALAARDLLHQADKNTAAIQLEAFRHKEELARQIAECCCEQKALTIEKANETQQLVRELDDRNVRERLRLAENELIALRVRATISPCPVGGIAL